jgi:Starch-binding associating with outer membrane
MKISTIDYFKIYSIMKKQLVILGALAVIIGLGSCSKSYFNVNNNPNSATNTTPNLVLPAALTLTASYQVAGTMPFSFWMGYYAPSGSYALSGNDPNASYKQVPTFADPAWATLYHNLKDYDYIEQASVTGEQPFYEAAAKVMKAYVFAQAVDVWNNVPYSQAFQGTLIIQPKYDSAQAIYTAIAAQLDTAVMLFNQGNAAGTPVSDVLFQGDNPSWIAFANTLKLRILMHQSEVPGRAAYISGEIAKIVANGGGFLTADAAVNPGYANNTGQQNPVYGYFITTTGLPTSGGPAADDTRAAKYSIDILSSLNDPRLGWLYAKAPDGTYKGNVLGSATNITGNLSSGIGPGVLKSVSQSAVLISAAESYFLQTEANIRGWLGAPGDAGTNFDAGVQASFDFLGAGDATTYYSQPGNKMTTWAAVSSFDDQLALLMRQKWISENSVMPFEAYNDYRRLHLPADIPISISTLADKLIIPTRFLYPQSEYNTNSANVNLQGVIDPYSSRIFWNQ